VRAELIIQSAPPRQSSLVLLSITLPHSRRPSATAASSTPDRPQTSAARVGTDATGEGPQEADSVAQLIRGEVVLWLWWVARKCFGALGRFPRGHAG